MVAGAMGRGRAYLLAAAACGLAMPSAVFAQDPMPSAERLATEGLALPMGPALDRESVETVVDEVRRSLAK